MAFDVTQFRSSLTTLASPALFDVQFLSVPGSVISQVDMQGRDLTFRCQSVDFPGRGLGETSARRNGISRTPIPYGILNDEAINVDLIVENGMETKKLFDAWIKQIGSPTGFSWQPSYLDDIVTEVKIRHYDSQGEVDYTVRLFDAYPSQLSAMTGDWSDTDNYIQIQVQLSYTYWDTE